MADVSLFSILMLEVPAKVCLAPLEQERRVLGFDWGILLGYYGAPI